MITSSVVVPLAHGPLLIDHLNLLAPNESPLTVVVAEFGLANEPLPDTTVHVPNAGEMGLLPESAVEFDGKQTVWS